jgi:hypothetical protein
MGHAFFFTARAREQGIGHATKVLDTMKYFCFFCGKSGKMKCCVRCKCAY